jgi:dTDP-4-amino-4,6-dideoxygalactose transaminase
MFPNRAVTLLGSGTQALALALRRSRERRVVHEPEAIIPAYGCPQLISACLWAGVRPRLVDLAQSQWAYNHGSLRATLNSNTVAIIAVNLLGAGDDALHLRALADEHRCTLIQDSAQYLARSPQSWIGDYVVLSFGRGKPANALGGGALLSAPDEAPGITASAKLRTRSTLAEWVQRSWLGAGLFNALSWPAIYGLVSRLPGTGIGATKYSPLPEVHRMSTKYSRRLGSVLSEYSRADSTILEAWMEIVASWRDFRIRPLVDLGSRATPPLLRLPVLAADTDQRNSLLHCFSREGLGASAMYEVPLNRIAGVPDIATGGTFPNAEDFASRLFTLPTHSLVTRSTVQKVNSIVHQLLADSRKETNAVPPNL